MPPEVKSGLLRSLRQIWRRLESEQEVRGTGVGAARAASMEAPTNATAAGCREDSVLILSHTDPQVSVSGVDRFVRAEIEALEAAGFCVWVLSPRAGLTPRTYTWRRGAELIADGCQPDFVRDERPVSAGGSRDEGGNTRSDEERRAPHSTGSEEGTPPSHSPAEWKCI